MTNYVTYKTDTGQICGSTMLPMGAPISTEPEEGTAFLVVDSVPDMASHYVLNGEIVACDKRPGPFHELKDGKWYLSEDAQRGIALRDRVIALADTDWMTTRHRDQQAAGTPTSLTEEQYIELLAYKQALRDWPVSGNYSEVFPEKPEWMQG